MQHRRFVIFASTFFALILTAGLWGQQRQPPGSSQKRRVGHRRSQAFLLCQGLELGRKVPQRRDDLQRTLVALGEGQGAEDDEELVVDIVGIGQGELVMDRPVAVDHLNRRAALVEL